MNTYNNITQDFFNNINEFGSNPMVLVILISIIVVYYIIFAFLGKGNSEDSSNGSFVFIEAIMWGLFIILILVNGLTYFFNINVITEIKNLFSDEPEIEIKSIIEETKNNQTDASLNEKEVYHIPGNKFTYHDAKAVCNAFDADIATFEQVDNAQKNGASWCSYGWSEGQLGIYPTSKSVFDKMQTKEENKYDCGLPGINGGYIPNPHVKLGSNCYGIKPKESELEKQYLTEDNGLPKSKKEILFEERVKFWKNRLGNILLLPFNSNGWYKL
tara:strand:+ start:5480 stop:6295 length:816 start_codon:yes stop_codon:yes gene_type:complete